jgi:O-acetyl-ADP-ribose deacetylase (regulator of RNase III)
MNPSSAYTLQINQTTIHIVEGDITQVEADVIVSSDDVYLSMSGGVSYAIRSAAGDSLREDVRKQPLPLTIGTVVVTTSGRLKARYVFHATTLDFTTHPPTDVLIARIMRRILEVGTALQVSHIALPLLGGGTAHLSRESVLKYILHSAMYYLATERFTIGKLTIVLLDISDLRSEIEEFAQKVSSTVHIQQKIGKMQALREETGNDEELAHMLNVRITDALEELRKAFHFEALDAASDTGIEVATPLSAESYRQARSQQLLKALAKLNEDANRAQKLGDIEEKRLRILERQVHEGETAPPEVVIETEEVRKRIQDIDRELAQTDKLRETYLRELKFSKTKLRLMFEERFNEGELRTFCFDLGGIEYDSLPGSGKEDKARELVEFCGRRDRIPELVKKLLQERPNISLDGVVEQE